MIVPYTVLLETAIIGFAIIIIFAAVVGFLFTPKLYRLHVLNDKSIYELDNMKVTNKMDATFTTLSSTDQTSKGKKRKDRSTTTTTEGSK